MRRHGPYATLWNLGNQLRTEAYSTSCTGMLVGGAVPPLDVHSCLIICDCNVSDTTAFGEHLRTVVDLLYRNCIISMRLANASRWPDWTDSKSVVPPQLHRVQIHISPPYIVKRRKSMVCVFCCSIVLLSCTTQTPPRFTSNPTSLLDF